MINWEQLGSKLRISTLENPLITSTYILYKALLYKAQFLLQQGIKYIKILVWHARGQEFDPPCLHHYKKIKDLLLASLFSYIIINNIL